MSNFLVETKNEYTTHLSNILTPLILEGLQSIYKEAVVIAEGKENELLKIFQSCLKRIPKWNTAMIEKETNRIINSSHSYGWLNDLIKATLKANLIVLMYNPTLKVQSKLDPSFYQNIRTVDFIHRVYIECARELWNNPYLLYHQFPPIEIKRNQRDCMNLIKDCIKEALRKLLPVKHVLEFYLGEDIDNTLANDQFEKAMSDAEERNLTKLIKKDLGSDNLLPQDNSRLEFDLNNSQRINTNTPKANSIKGTDTPKSILKTNSEEKTIDGITFKLERRFDGKHIFKEIYFSDKGQDFHFTERVQALNLQDFQALLSANFRILETFGSFDLAPFSAANSDRLIIIAELKS